jgi:hypothetical protein
MVPTGAGFLPTVKNQVERNVSEAAAGVGLGDGAGLGDGIGVGVGVGVGCILLETEPQPASNIKNPMNKKRVTVRTQSSLDLNFQLRRGTVLIGRRAAAQRRLSRETI